MQMTVKQTECYVCNVLHSVVAIATLHLKWATDARGSKLGVLLDVLAAISDDADPLVA